MNKLFQEELSQTHSKSHDLKEELMSLKNQLKEYQYIEKLLADNGIVDQEKIHIINTITDIKSKKSNLKCWFCTHKFDTIPIGLPEYYDSETKTYKTTGIFCSFNCAHAYNINLNDYKVFTRLALLHQIKNLIFKNEKRENMKIAPSPDKKLLKDYGGPLTIHEYRKNNIFIPSHTVVPPLFTPYFESIEEIPLYYHNKNIKSNKYKKFNLRLTH